MQPIDVATASVTPFEATKHHAQLAPLVGSWEGSTKTWFDPSKPPEESRTQARVESVLGGRFLRIQYAGTAMGKPHAGEMILAYEKDEKRYALAWIDSFHTGTLLMSSTGTSTDDGVVSVLGSYPAGEQRWGWRTVIHTNPERFVIEAFNISPDGHEDPAIKTELRRV